MFRIKTHDDDDDDDMIIIIIVIIIYLAGFLVLVTCSGPMNSLGIFFEGSSLASFPTRLIFHNEVWQSVRLRPLAEHAAPIYFCNF